MADEQDPTPWLQVDLGAVHAITRTEAYFVTPTAGHSYRIESSTDNTHWTIYQPVQPLTIESPHTTHRNDVSALSACLCDERHAWPLGVSRMAKYTAARESSGERWLHVDRSYLVRWRSRE